MIDEDEVIEVVAWGGEVRTIPVGIDHAIARARARYIDGHIEVEDLEREVERLMRKRAALA